MSSVAAPFGATTILTDLDNITDEERLRVMWQQAEDFGDRRRIRARMYKLREQRLREMVQNDEESLGTLTTTDDGGVTERTETTITVGSDGSETRTTTTTRRSSNIEVKMHVDGDSATTDSISTQNVRLGGLTMRGVDSVALEGQSAEDVIKERMRKGSQERTTRYQRILGELSDDANSDGDAVVSITKSTYSIQSNALAGEGYLSMKNKEVRDSVSPTRIMRERRSSAEDDVSANEGRLTSDDEGVMRTESESRTTETKTTTSTSRKTSRDERASARTARTSKSEIPVRSTTTRKVSERKTSKELDLGASRRAGAGDKASPTSPSKRTPGDTSSRIQMTRKTGAQKEAPVTTTKTTVKTTKTGIPSRKSKLADIEAKMETSIMSELDKLDSYLSASVDDDDEVIMEEEEECLDDSGNVVKMLVQTRRKKDGTEYSARRVARSTKIVNSESEIDEILVGNPDHEVVERDVTEEEDKDGNKIKIITETRRRPDGIVYTTKNVLKTSKIFDYDHPEDVAYNEDDELISTDKTEETDENGITIQTVTETRRKPNGVEYTTKKVYKTSKVKSTQITPSDDDEVIDTQETEEKKEDGSIIRTVIETRRTKGGEEYTHRQVFRSRRMTLSGVDLQKGLPTIQNDDEVLSKDEKEETDENGMKIKVVTETRKRKDGSTYSFEYVLRSFQGTEEDVRKMPIGSACSSNIPVSAEDELINEEVKEEVQTDGSTVKTIIERRRAKDGTEYLRHRIMRIPKMPEPVLQVASLEDEVLQTEVNEETLNDGTHYKAVTERRRSSVSGAQYTLRRMSKVYQQASIHPKTSEDEILDENVTEEETDEGTIIKTVIQRYQRPDGSVYTTHNIQKMFSSPAPVTFVGAENDELIDQTVDEEETSDGYIIKTVTETRERADGVRYTVERTEKTSKHGAQVHISFSERRRQKPEEVIQISSPDDTLVSSEEKQHEEEDGTIIKTIIEIRRRVDGTEYTSKTVLRTTPVLVPERETSYVVIRPEDGDDDESGLFPSLDDEVVYTRKKEETDEYGNVITVIIETRQSKQTGEKYNITKRVHTKDVIMTEEGEKEIPKPMKKSTLEAKISPEEPDDVPYGSVSALKNRFAPGKKPSDSTPKSGKPDRANTSSKKKFFEDAAKTASADVPSFKSSLKKPDSKDRPRDTDTDAKRDLLPSFTSDKPSVEVKLRVEKDEATVEKVSMQKVTSEFTEETDVTDIKETDIRDLDTEIARLEEEEKERYEQEEPEPETDEPDEEKEPEEELSSPTEDEPQEPGRRKPDAKKAPVTSRTTRRKPEEEPKKRREVSPRKKPESEEPSKRVPVGTRKAPAKDDSPTRRVPSQRDPVAPRDTTKRAPKPTTSPQRVPSSPHRGRSPIRSGVSTPREVTPTGRQCCKRHREANATEPVSPTRPQKAEPTSPTRGQKPDPSSPTRRTTRSPPLKKSVSPDSKPKMNGDVRRPEPRTNGDIGRKPEDKTPRTRRPLEKPSEPERTTARPTRSSQSPRKSPPTRSPDKREPTRTVPSRTTDRKTPTSRLTDKTPRGRTSEPDSKDRLKPGARDPVVTLPETPMTEDMKPLPSDEEYSPTIEDVSGEPDLPYHTVHRPSLVREPSEYPSDGLEASDSSPEEKPEQPDEPSEEEEPIKKRPVDDDDTIKPRRTRPLESRPSDKNITKKAPDTKQSPRDRGSLSDKKNFFEKKASETKLTPKPDEDRKTPERRRPFERKPSDDKMKKPKDSEKKPKDEPSTEEASPSEDESRENGVPEESPRYISPKQRSPQPDRQPKKTEDITSRYLGDVEKSVSSQIITDKKITTTDVAARRSAFDRRTPDKKDTPNRKPSYEIKESVFAKRSLFEQAKQDPVPSPIKRPTLKSTVKKDDKPKEPEVRKPLKETKEPEERKPVKEPLIVPKYFHPLTDGEEDEEPVEKTVKEEVNEDIKITSSKLVMSAMASTRETTTKETRKTTRRTEEPSDDEDDRPEDERPHRREPFSKEGSPIPRSKEGSPAPFSKEGSPFSKEGSPTRFVTGKPVDSGINTNKIRRIERASSNKKLLEDLEVSRENLPEYLKSIEKIFDIVILESMLEKAETYEERRLIRGQMRVAKRPSTTPGTTSSPATYKRFVDMTPSKPSPTASPQPTRRFQKPEEPKKEPSFGDAKRKPISKSEERRPSSTRQDTGDTPSPRRPASTRPDETDGEPREPRREPEEEPEEPRRTSRRDRDEEPRRTSRRDRDEEPKKVPEPKKVQEPKKDEEPKRFGRFSKPEEPKVEPSRKQPTKTAPTNEPYVEPLRYQKGQNKTPVKVSTPQSHVDEIVSAYGVGPTDDKGMPLFGLRALKKRTPTTTDTTTPKEEEAPKAPSEDQPVGRRAPEEPLSEPEEPKKDTFEPTDASGRPLFGLRALKAKDTTRETSYRDTTTSVVESSRLVSGVTKRTTHTTEEVTTTESPRDSESSESEVDSQAESDDDESSGEQSPDEEETSPGLVRNLRDSLKRGDTPEDSRSPGRSSPRHKDSPDDEVIGKRSQPLRDILKLHESKVGQEPTTTEDSPRPKPKQKLRDSFEPSPDQQETRAYKTWDLESDLSTRSLNMKNIIERHETITAEETPKPEKKLTGILKKTSTSNLQVTDTRTETTHAESTDDILDTLTEDQIAKLSEEFDLRAQEDGVIKTKESLEELTTGYRVTSRTEVDHPEGAKFERKTSYTEIKLQQPSKDEGSRVVTSSSSATVEHTGSSSFSVTRGTADEDDEMREGRSFLEDRSKVTGFSDVLTRMGATEAVDPEAKVTSDDQARSLLNRFLGAQVLMSGVESMMASSSMSESSKMTTDGSGQTTITEEASGHSESKAAKNGVVTDQKSSSFSTGPQTTTVSSSAVSKVEPVLVAGVNISEVTDDFRLNQLLDSCDEYEDRRRIRMRLKTLMAEKKGLREDLSGHEQGRGSRSQTSTAQSKFEAMSKSTTSSTKDSDLRSSEGESKTSSTVSPFGVSRTSNTESRSSSQVNVQKSSYSSSTSSSYKTSSMSKVDSKKVVSPFDKFKQMDAQTPRTPKE